MCIIFRDFNLKGLPADYDFELQAGVLNFDTVLDDFYGGEDKKKISKRNCA